MLQRIQTIYLILVFTSSLLLLFFPIFDLSLFANDGALVMSSKFGAYGVTGDSVQPSSLYLLFVLFAMLSVAAIFLYKNRKKQLLVCRINLGLQAITVVSFIAAYYFGFEFIKLQNSDLSNVVSNAKINGAAGYYILLVGIPFLLLAIRGIKADEALLKSLDRLR